VLLDAFVVEVSVERSESVWGEGGNVENGQIDV